jgi:hypothetical protein
MATEQTPRSARPKAALTKRACDEVQPRLLSARLSVTPLAITPM